MKNKIYYILFAILFIAPFNSCTNLEEEVFSSLPAENFYTTEDAVLSAVGRAYAHLTVRYSYHGGAWGIQVISSDEAVIPVREGNAWWDNGVWVALHRHDFGSIKNFFNAPWNFVLEGATTCNQIIYELERTKVDFEKKNNFIAEVKVIRALLYFYGLDLFGNIPITTDFSDTSLPTQRSRAEVFKFVESELLTNVDLLEDAPTANNYGRVTKAMAYTLLAKLYLNAEVWIGTPMWQKAIDATDRVINLGTLKLESNYFKNFQASNESSTENIFVIPQDDVFTPWGFYVNALSLNNASRPLFNMSTFCWNGMAATEQHYDLYQEKDKRRKSWLAGLQTHNGVPLMITSLGVSRQLNHRKNFRSFYDPKNFALVDDGVRFQKYQYEDGLRGYAMSNDFVMFRYADVLMMKGEALVRLGKASEAVGLFNQVRNRAGVDAYNASDLTLEEILNERGREFAWEGERRRDQIRFGTWTKAWWEKPARADYTELFPIPDSPLQTNPNLKQNPGY